MTIDFPAVDPRVKIFALTGPRCSGKSTAAAVLLRIDPRFKRASFAQALKEEYCQLNGLPPAETWSAQFKEQHRHGLIDLSLTRKAVDPWYFGKKLFSNLPNSEYIVIDDTRFFVELFFILERRGIVYKINTPEWRRIANGWRYDEQIDNDPSEREIGSLSGKQLNELTGGRGGEISNCGDESNLEWQLKSVAKFFFP